MKLSSLCTTYLKLIERTCTIRFHGVEDLSDNFIVGFWHQDSLLMSLVLRIMARQGMPLTVVMTADPRGDTIEEVVRAFDGKAFRLSYSGRTSLTALKSLIEHTLQENANIATPLDGPLGPLYVPKKFHFLLANKTRRAFVGARVTYSRKLALTKRWDDYRIPLPFTTIDIYAYDFGPVSEDNLRNFDDYQQVIQEQLLSPESYAATLAREKAGRKKGKAQAAKEPENPLADAAEPEKLEAATVGKESGTPAEFAETQPDETGREAATASHANLQTQKAASGPSQNMLGPSALNRETA